MSDDNDNYNIEDQIEIQIPHPRVNTLRQERFEEAKQKTQKFCTILNGLCKEFDFSSKIDMVRAVDAMNATRANMNLINAINLLFCTFFYENFYAAFEIISYCVDDIKNGADASKVVEGLTFHLNSRTQAGKTLVCIILVMFLPMIVYQETGKLIDVLALTAPYTNMHAQTIKELRQWTGDPDVEWILSYMTIKSSNDEIRATESKKYKKVVEEHECDVASFHQIMLGCNDLGKQRFFCRTPKQDNLNNVDAIYNRKDTFACVLICDEFHHGNIVHFGRKNILEQYILHKYTLGSQKGKKPFYFVGMSATGYPLIPELYAVRKPKTINLKTGSNYHGIEHNEYVVLEDVAPVFEHIVSIQGKKYQPPKIKSDKKFPGRASGKSEPVYNGQDLEEGLMKIARKGRGLVVRLFPNEKYTNEWMNWIRDNPSSRFYVIVNHGDGRKEIDKESMIEALEIAEQSDRFLIILVTGGARMGENYPDNLDYIDFSQKFGAIDTMVQAMAGRATGYNKTRCRIYLSRYNVNMVTCYIENWLSKHDENNFDIDYTNPKTGEKYDLGKGLISTQENGKICRIGYSAYGFPNVIDDNHELQKIFKQVNKTVKMATDDRLDKDGNYTKTLQGLFPRGTKAIDKDTIYILFRLVKKMGFEIVLFFSDDIIHNLYGNSDHQKDICSEAAEMSGRVDSRRRKDVEKRKENEAQSKKNVAFSFVRVDERGRYLSKREKNLCKALKLVGIQIPLEEKIDKENKTKFGSGRDVSVFAPQAAVDRKL
jgi:hypothetical protein